MVGGVNFIGPDVVGRLVDAGHEVLSYHSAAHERELPAAVRHLHGRGERFDRFIAVRRSGSVEYGAYCSWLHHTVAGKLWLLHEKQAILQFGQFLHFLEDLATSFELPKSWTIWCNARDVKKAVLIGFGEGWTTPFDSFRGQATFCLEEQFQLELSFASGPQSFDGLIDEFAVRFDLAFGSTTPRAYNRSGNTVGSITYSDVRYE